MKMSANIGDQQTCVRPECGEFQTGTRIYSAPLRRFDARPFTAHSGHRIKSQSMPQVEARSDRGGRRAKAIRPACVPVIRRAFVARLVRAPAVESRDWDFAADLPAAARSAVPV